MTINNQFLFKFFLTVGPFLCAFSAFSAGADELDRELTVLIVSSHLAAENSARPHPSLATVLNSLIEDQAVQLQAKRVMIQVPLNNALPLQNGIPHMATSHLDFIFKNEIYVRNSSNASQPEKKLTMLLRPRTPTVLFPMNAAPEIIYERLNNGKIRNLLIILCDRISTPGSQERLGIAKHALRTVTHGLEVYEQARRAGINVTLTTLPFDDHKTGVLANGVIERAFTEGPNAAPPDPQSIDDSRLQQVLARLVPSSEGASKDQVVQIPAPAHRRLPGPLTVGLQWVPSDRGAAPDIGNVMGRLLTSCDRLVGNGR